MMGLGVKVGLGTGKSACSITPYCNIGKQCVIFHKLSWVSLSGWKAALYTVWGITVIIVQMSLQNPMMTQSTNLSGKANCSWVLYTRCILLPLESQALSSSVIWKIYGVYTCMYNEWKDVGSRVDSQKEHQKWQFPQTYPEDTLHLFWMQWERHCTPPKLFGSRRITAGIIFP